MAACTREKTRCHHDRPDLHPSVKLTEGIIKQLKLKDKMWSSSTFAMCCWSSHLTFYMLNQITTNLIENLFSHIQILKNKVQM